MDDYSWLLAYILRQILCTNFTRLPFQANKDPKFDQQGNKQSRAFFLSYFDLKLS